MEKKDLINLLIFIFSLVGIILLATNPFGGLFYIDEYYQGYRYSGLGYGYSTVVDLTAMIFALILLIIQCFIALNNLLPQPLIAKDLSLINLFIGILIIILGIIGLIGFVVIYNAFEAWPEAGFYGIIIPGILNTILIWFSKR